ncbi:RDD family protein [Neisseria chenwenguii]|uniref:RDD domain-containing protein n=1 Tax=Neisseria chenwenguii TaxID=1853278 RepID=A0A220S1M7_9NEIS|nr:RDD family protein [Neisseria chenwenguii]ASK27410.1 hypothetical protein BG910_06345 [Neisseria chenwenguii]ROV56918.1 hypothetical protein EGS38_01845 [Neisseria chenwenguii]
MYAATGSAHPMFLYHQIQTQSVGKETVGIQPVNIRTGQPVSAVRYFMRIGLPFLAGWAFGFGSYLFLNCVLILAESNNHRTLDDLLAGSVVVRVK